MKTRNPQLTARKTHDSAPLPAKHNTLFEYRYHYLIIGFCTRMLRYNYYYRRIDSK